MTQEVYTAGHPPIVSTEWLSERMGDGDHVAVDMRPPYFFGQAHLPGAVSLPGILLQGRDGGPIDGPELSGRLGDLGLTRDTHIVAYDEGGSPAAAQLYWILRYYRHPRVSVLDGGITKWRHEGRDWEYSVRVPSPARYEIGESDSSVYATLDDLRAAAQGHSAVILDVRTPAEFLGLQATAQRNGHIPGAINLEWSNALHADRDGLPILRPAEEIRELLAGSGITPESEIIVHCQSGGRSSFAYLVLDALGFASVRHYAAGCQEWGNRQDTPVEEG